MLDWSYERYRAVLKQYAHRTVSFSDAIYSSNFVLLRHDVEFSPLLAMRMAEIDKQAGAHSSFYFQVSSNFYNLAASLNLEIVRRISDYGFEVGPHINLPNKNGINLEETLLEIKNQKDIFFSITGIMPNSFSMHRPRNSFLSMREDYVNGMINSYGPSFFEYSKNPKNIKYISDSRHRFDYGDPYFNISNYNMIQLLIHPEEWSSSGGSRQQSLSNIVGERSKELFDNIIEECEIEL